MRREDLCSERVVRRTLLASLSGIALALAPAIAHADSTSLPGLVVHEEGEGARECPSADAIAATVESLMGHPALAPSDDAAPGDAAPSEGVYNVHVARGGLYTASITTPSGAERDLSDPGPGCSGLADAVALTLAILLDPEGRAPAPHAPTPAKPAKKDSKPAPARRAPAPKPERVAWLSARALGGGALGVLSSAVPAAWGEIDARPSRLLSLGAGVLVPASSSAAFGPSPGQVDFALVAGYLRLCGPEIGPARALVRVCLQPMLGSVRIAGSGYSQRNETSRPIWGALGLGASLDVALAGPLGLVVDATGLVAGRTEYTVKGPDAPAPGTLPRLGAILGAGLRVSIF
jgi:hypothetical protein